MSARILVVDDNRPNLDLMTYLLESFGYPTKAESDGLAGIAVAQRERFDVVLSDVLMPGIDGYEFARRYKAAGRGPLIAVTALAMVGDRERLLEAGFDGYIPKPIDPQTFVAQVEAFVPASLRATPRE